MSITAAFAPKSGKELKGAVDALARPLFQIVDIDVGLSKYLLMHMKTPDRKNFFAVRGRAGPAYTNHHDVLAAVIDEIEQADLQYEVFGGGMIEHVPEKKTIKIYGTRLCDVSGEVWPCFQKLKYMHIDGKTV